MKSLWAHSRCQNIKRLALNILSTCLDFLIGDLHSDFPHLSNGFHEYTGTLTMSQYSIESLKIIISRVPQS